MPRPQVRGLFGRARERPEIPPVRQVERSHRFAEAKHLLGGKGRRQILDFLLPGSLIGLHALWFKAMPHSAQTLTSVSLCAFDKEKFRDLLRRQPEYEVELLKYMASSQASRDRRLSDLGRRPGRVRIARLILEIFGQLTARDMVDGHSFTFYPRQQHVADALGLTKVHVSRTLQALRQEGLLEIGRDTATILDIKGLKELADYTETEATGC